MPPDPTSPHPLRTPPDLGERFTADELLGAGGSAEVWRGHDHRLDREVALKVLHASPSDPAARERLAAEARTVARLSHPHLVALLDVGRSPAAAGDRPFLVTELVRGRSLADVLGAGPLAPEQVAVLGSQVASALACAHEHGVVHRDVKPANVLVDERGAARLTDFGIARLLAEASTVTATGTTVGTAAYLAPEQLEGATPTGAVDVYALGLVLLEALTGARAFSGTTSEAVAARLVRDPAVPGDLPPGWHDLLTAATRRDPAARPTAAELADRLEQLAQGRTQAAAAGDASATRVMPTSTAPAPAASPSAAPRSRRSLVLAGAALAAVVAVVVAVLLASGGNAPPEQADRSGQAPAEAPADAPADLRGPLQDLHDAVVGR